MDKKLDTKDLINVGIFTALYFAIVFIVAFVGYIPIMMIIMPALCALIGGIPFMLFLTRTKKFGMVTIMGTLLGLLTFLLGRPWLSVLFGIIAGLVADLYLKGTDYRSIGKAPLSCGIFSLWIVGMALSGGQKQRVAIAGDVVSDAPVLLFDEPTSGLDLRHMKQVADLFRLLKDEGRTVLVITHDTELVKEVADDIVSMP